MIRLGPSYQIDDLMTLISHDIVVPFLILCYSRLENRESAV